MDPLMRLPDGQEVLLSAIQNDHNTRAHYLSPFHAARLPVICQCRDQGIPMGIARRSGSTELFYLYPLHRSDPVRHRLGCPHRPHKPAADSTRERPEVEEHKGQINVNLDGATFRRPSTPRRKGEPTDEEGETKEQLRRTGTLRTLLEVLWSEAELHHWHPDWEGKRSYWVVYKRLLRAAAGVIINRRQPLASHIFVPAPFNPQRKVELEAELEAFLERLKPSERGQRPLGYVAGIFKAPTQKPSGRVALSVAHSRLNVWCDPKVWTRLSKRWFHRLPADGAGAEELPPMFVLLRVDRKEGERGMWLELDDLAALELADRDTWLPAESPYHRQLAQHLVSTKRQFRRPLSVEAEGCAPAFVLEDRDDRLHLEILSEMSDPDYAAAAANNRQWYEAAELAAWWWDVEASPEVPLLPGPAAAAGTGTPSEGTVN